jgi:Peptidase family S41
MNHTPLWLAFALAFFVVAGCPEPLPFDIDDDDDVADDDTADLGPMQQQLEELWDVFDEVYPYFVHKGIDWDVLGDEARAQLGEDASYDEWVAAVEGLLMPLHDNHVYLYTPDGDLVYPGYTGFSQNIEWSVVDGQYLTGIEHSGDVTIGWLDGGLAYIRVDSWTDEGAPDAVDAALEDFSAAPGLVLDVRANGGGNELLAMGVAGRFAEQTTLYGYVQYRDGPDHDDFTDLYERNMPAIGPWTWTQPVAVLTGDFCMSSNEAFVAAMREIPGVTTVGADTRGSTGNPTMVELDDGTQLFLSTWIAYLPDMQVIEDQGIPVDVPVAWGGPGDPVLDATIDLLGT